ncbi:zinc ABC transporter substrate-binding protein [Halovulum sp. GXIMD14793]
MRLLPVAASVCLLAGQVFAEAPKVVTDIAPVHSLVARVMQGVGDPQILVEPGAGSPHGVSLKPSQARMLSEADLIIWVGPQLTPWLDKAVDGLGAGTPQVVLHDLPDLPLKPFRTGALFATEEHEGHDDHEGAKPDEEHVHADEHEHEDDHRDEHEDEHGHHHHGDGPDPHAWMDPEIAALWVEAIADALAAADPDNAAIYRRNAVEAQTELAVLTAEIDEMLTPAKGKPFLVYHDAFQYFETRFGLEAIGAIQDGHANRPGPARLASLRKVIEHEGVTCIMAEPKVDASAIDVVIEGSDAIRVSTADQLGTDLPAGADLYPEMLRNMATAALECLSGK